MPFVTSGSLVNFCDVLMAGGTDRKNHSEIGSLYVHCNFTPHQDKATASLLGDVPRGVMLDQPPIFLGGQGSLVGPVRIAYGTVLGAGTVWRRDVETPGRLLVGSTGEALREIPFTPGRYGNIAYKLVNGVRYIANLHALLAWYRDVRHSRFSRTPAAGAVYAGAIDVLTMAIGERVQRLDQLAANIPRSLKLGGHGPHDVLQERFADAWPRMRDGLADTDIERGDAATRDRFLRQLSPQANASYLDTIKQLHTDAKNAGTAWLQTIVDSTVAASGISALTPDT
jgi:UDP-N-acetylglucosamine/UDP-N-acetylgalactosamine diphosphorylase